MEFFENQVGEVRYLTTLPDPTTAAASATATATATGAVVPPITPGTSSSPAASTAASITNTGISNTGADAPPTNHSLPAGHRAQPRPTIIHNNSNKPDKRAKKQAPTPARHDTITSSATPSVSASTPGATTAPVAGAKRKNPGGDADDDDDEGSPNAPRSGPQQRSKRNRYISIACNECKRRKIKCNGETPCGRCGHLNLQCLYAPNCCSSSVKDSDEFKQMAAQVNHLQEQVEVLFNNLNSLRAETLRSGSLHQPERTLNGPSAASTPSSTTLTMLPQPQQQQPRQPSFGFRGPTSNRFSLDVAKNTLHKMGYSYPSDNVDANGHTHETPSTSPRLAPQTVRPGDDQPTVDALWELDKDEMIRLCRIYEEEVGIMYPVLCIDSIINHAKTLATWMEAAKKNGLAGGQNGGINDPNTLLLKIVLCSGLLVEGHGSSVQAQRIFAGIKSIANRMLMSDPPNIQTLPFLALVVCSTPPHFRSHPLHLAFHNN